MINKKEIGRKVRVDALLDLALNLVTAEHIKMLQDHSLTNEDRKEILRQQYVATRGPISKDEFTGFMMTAAFYEFLKEQQAEANFDSQDTESATLAG